MDEDIIRIFETTKSFGYSLENSFHNNALYKTVKRKFYLTPSLCHRDTSDITKAASKEEPLSKKDMIGHHFTEVTLNELKVGQADFLEKNEKK